MSEKAAGTRIRFLRTIEEGPDDCAPGRLFATKGSTGEIIRFDPARPRPWLVKWDRWKNPFWAARDEFEYMEE